MTDRVHRVLTRPRQIAARIRGVLSEEEGLRMAMLPGAVQYDGVSVTSTPDSDPMSTYAARLDELERKRLDLLSDIIDALNEARDLYLRTKNKDNWWEMIQLLPSSYNQKRTVTMSYENARSIIHQRRGHKLDEWNRLCDVLETLPYMEDLIGKGGIRK